MFREEVGEGKTEVPEVPARPPSLVASQLDRRLPGKQDGEALVARIRLPASPTAEPGDTEPRVAPFPGDRILTITRSSHCFIGNGLVRGAGRGSVNPGQLASWSYEPRGTVVNMPKFRPGERGRRRKGDRERRTDDGGQKTGDS